jgi:hypothetical protein
MDDISILDPALFKEFFFGNEWDTYLPYEVDINDAYHQALISDTMTSASNSDLMEPRVPTALLSPPTSSNSLTTDNHSTVNEKAKIFKVVHHYRKRINGKNATMFECKTYDGNGVEKKIVMERMEMKQFEKASRAKKEYLKELKTKHHRRI